MLYFIFEAISFNSTIREKSLKTYINYKTLFYSVALALILACLSSCKNEVVANPGDGIGRERVQPRETTEISKKTEAETAADNASDGKIWAFADGKYVFNFPERSDEGLSTIDEMYDMSTARFDDQPDDWFFGKTVRDNETGEVTYVWDRSADTLETLKKYRTIYRGDETRKVFYLTFDCGYEYGTMDAILDTLKEKQVSATFFVNGHYVRSASDKIQRMIDEGHVIGNHAVNHYDLTGVSVDTFLEEVQGLEELYYETLPDAPPMLYFRPPSGDCNEWVLKFADKLGYRTVMWSWAYMDFDTDAQPDVDETLEKVMTGLHNGEVMLLHPESKTNTEMLGKMIDKIRDAGFEILPICDIE